MLLVLSKFIKERQVILKSMKFMRIMTKRITALLTAQCGVESQITHSTVCNGVCGTDPRMYRMCAFN